MFLSFLTGYATANVRFHLLEIATGSLKANIHSCITRVWVQHHALVVKVYHRFCRLSTANANQDFCVGAFHAKVRNQRLFCTPPSCWSLPRLVLVKSSGTGKDGGRSSQKVRLLCGHRRLRLLRLPPGLDPPPLPGQRAGKERFGPCLYPGLLRRQPNPGPLVRREPLVPPPLAAS